MNMSVHLSVPRPDQTCLMLLIFILQAHIHFQHILKQGHGVVFDHSWNPPRYLSGLFKK